MNRIKMSWFVSFFVSSLAFYLFYSIQTFLIHINLHLETFKSYHVFLIRINLRSFNFFLPEWIVSNILDSYQSSSRNFWIVSNILDSYQILTTSYFPFSHVWIESDFYWIDSLRCFFLKYCTYHSFVYISISILLSNYWINCNCLSLVFKPLFPLVLKLTLFLRIFVVF